MCPRRQSHVSKRETWGTRIHCVSRFAPLPPDSCVPHGWYSKSTMAAGTDKTFFIETFGCQMNVHDTEKVVGTLQQQGYRAVETEAEAGLILYNTCSIRDKAEQKVFNRLNDYKKLH